MHGGNLELAVPLQGFRADEMLDFSANINPYGPPPGFKHILSGHADEIVRYPDPDSAQLRKVLAEYHGVGPENIVAGNGASELIAWVSRLWNNPRALIYAPAFTEYARSVESACGSVMYKFADEEHGFRHEFDAQDAAKINPQLVFIGNPNNPTGTFYSKEMLADFLEQCLKKSADALFVCDESFLPFTGGEEESLSVFAGKNSRIVVLRSLTKILSVPGLRAGYAVSSAAIVAKLERCMPVWRMNTFAQRFGERVMEFRGFVRESVLALTEARQALINDIRGIPDLTVFESRANFVLIKTRRARFLCDGCAQKGIVIRHCGDFAGLEDDRFVRAAVRKPEENRRLAAALKETVSSAG